MLRKIYLVVDCDNDSQKEQLQEIMNGISNMRAFTASDIIRVKPAFENNRNTIMELFQMIQKGGISAIFSVRGGMLLNKLKK